MKLFIQILLILAILFLIIFFLSHQNSKTAAYKKIFAAFFVIFALVAVIFPEITNKIANFLGISRGADLLLYILVVVVGFYIINSGISKKEEARRIAKLAREITVLKAQNENFGKNLNKKLENNSQNNSQNSDENSAQNLQNNSQKDFENSAKKIDENLKKFRGKNLKKR